MILRQVIVNYKWSLEMHGSQDYTAVWDGLKVDVCEVRVVGCAD